MDREAWRAAVHGVAKSRTRLSNWTELNWIHSIRSLSFSLFNCFPLWLKSVLVSVSFMYFVFISVAWVDWPKVDIVPFYVGLISIVDLFMEFYGVMAYDSVLKPSWTDFHDMISGCVLTWQSPMGLSKFAYTTGWRDCRLPSVYSWLFVEDPLSLGVQVHSWALSPVPFICTSLFVLVSGYWHYCTVVVVSKVWEGFPSCFVLSLKAGFGNSGSSMALHKL